MAYIFLSLLISGCATKYRSSNGEVIACEKLEHNTLMNCSDGKDHHCAVRPCALYVEDKRGSYWNRE